MKKSNSKEVLGGVGDSHASVGGPLINLNKKDHDVEKNEVQASYKTLKNYIEKNVTSSPDKKINASIQSMHYRHR